MELSGCHHRGRSQQKTILYFEACFVYQIRSHDPSVHDCKFVLREERVEDGSAVLALRESFIGGAKRDRTADLLVANEALSQLSYSPTLWREILPEFISPVPIAEAMALAHRV